MIGAIIGDILGSRFEMKRAPMTKAFDFFSPRTCFTDDTVLTVASAYALLHGISYVEAYEMFYLKYPNSGYGSAFIEWAKAEKKEPYNSYGNGSAMRVSPVAYFYDNLENVLIAAENSAKVTHNHEEGIKGAKAIALCTYMAKHGNNKSDIYESVQLMTGYKDLMDAKKLWTGKFSSSCQDTVPQAICAFLSGHDYESCVRNAIMFGGDADTLASMAGAIAGEYYGVPLELAQRSLSYLSDDLASIVSAFMSAKGPHVRPEIFDNVGTAMSFSKTDTNKIDDGLLDMEREKKEIKVCEKSPIHDLLGDHILTI